MAGFLARELGGASGAARPCPPSGVRGVLLAEVHRSTHNHRLVLAAWALMGLAASPHVLFLSCITLRDNLIQIVCALLQAEAFFRKLLRSLDKPSGALPQFRNDFFGFRTSGVFWHRHRMIRRQAPSANASRSVPPAGIGWCSRTSLVGF